MDVTSEGEIRSFLNESIHHSSYNYVRSSRPVKPIIDTDDYNPNQIHAYIRVSTPMKEGTSVGYTHHAGTTFRAKPDAVYEWHYCDDPKIIIDAPIDDVVFVLDNDDEYHSATLLKIIEKLGLNPIKLDHIRLFDIVFKNTPREKFIVNTQPSLFINKNNYTNHIKSFAKYIKATNVDFDYSHWNTSIAYYHKREFNKYGIYVRPVKKLFCYNPILAKRQTDIIRAGQKKRDNRAVNSAPKIYAWDLESVFTALQRVFTRNLGFTIEYPSLTRSYRTKIWYSNKILELIDLHNVFFRTHAYRDLEPFKDLMKKWKKADDKDRFGYPPKFIKWIDKECLIRRRPAKNKNDTYWLSVEPKSLSRFKVSKIQWLNKPIKRK